MQVAYRRWHQEVGNQFPDCQSVDFSQGDGERATLRSLATRSASIGAYRALLKGQMAINLVPASDMRRVPLYGWK